MKTGVRVTGVPEMDSALGTIYLGVTGVDRITLVIILSYNELHTLLFWSFNYNHSFQEILHLHRWVVSQLLINLPLSLSKNHYVSPILVWMSWVVWPSIVETFCAILTCNFTTADAWVVKCVRVYVQVCQLNCVMWHIASTDSWLMTNGTNYKWGKLHHSPWNSEKYTSNHLNTPPDWISCLFQSSSKHRRREAK